MRRKIEIAPGTLAPTARSLWSAAIEKLLEAEYGLSQMVKANDRIEFEQGWTRSVDSLEQFWTRFVDEGKQRFTNFQPWAGAIDAQRKSDPLTHYLFQARHQSQHGCISLEWDAGQLQIAPGFSGHIRRLQVFSDGTFIFDADKAHDLVREPTVVFSGGNARLPVIINKRFNQIFSPPKAHCSRIFTELSPLEAIRLGIEYYNNNLKVALKKFSPKA